jgi:hypothetical protein
MASPRQDREIGLVRGQNPLTGERFSVYNPEIALEIVEKVANGELLKDITKRDGGYPHISTVRRWLAQHPEFKQAMDAAREVSSYSFEEDAISIARDVYKSPGTTQKIRAALQLMDQLRWSATRRNPNTFSEKGSLNVIVPVNINTSLDLGGGSKTHPQAAAVPEVYKFSVPQTVEEGQFTEVQEDEEDAAAKPKPLLARPRVSTRKRVLTPRVPMDTELVPKHSQAGRKS